MQVGSGILIIESINKFKSFVKGKFTILENLHNKVLSEHMVSVHFDGDDIDNLSKLVQGSMKDVATPWFNELWNDTRTFIVFKKGIVIASERELVLNKSGSINKAVGYWDKLLIKAQGC
jgi:hypothetical protein